MMRAIAFIAALLLSAPAHAQTQGQPGGSSGSSTITANSTATSGCSSNTVLYSDGSKAQCSATLPFALATTPTQAANTSADGYVLVDSTPATTGNQQFSPRLRLTGQGWKTTATAASQAVDWIMETQPVQNTTAPTNTFVWSSQTNGAGYLRQMSLFLNPANSAQNGLIVGDSTSSTTLSVYPGNDGSGSLGLSTNRWASGFFFGNITLNGVASTVNTVNVVASGDTQSATYHVGATAGASCTLTTIAHLTVVNGIVTLCN